MCTKYKSAALTTPNTYVHQLVGVVYTKVLRHSLCICSRHLHVLEMLFIGVMQEYGRSGRKLTIRKSEREKKSRGSGD